MGFACHPTLAKHVISRLRLGGDVLNRLDGSERRAAFNPETQMSHESIWPDAALEKQMLGDCEEAEGSQYESLRNLACHVRALLDRVRGLEVQCGIGPIGGYDAWKQPQEPNA